MGRLVVEPEVIDVIGTCLVNMGTAAGDAHRYLTTYISEDGEGGWIYREACTRIGTVRTSLETSYQTCAAEVSRTGANVKTIAREYLAADTEAERAAMADADRVLDVSDLRGGETYHRSEQMFWRQELDDKLEDVEFGYTRSNSTGWVALDLPPTDQYFEDAHVTNIWYGLKDGVDYLLHLGMDLDPTLSQFGLANPVAEFADKFEGDWERVGTAVMGMKMLSSFWMDLGAEVYALDRKIASGVWEGHAASIASQWLLSFAEATESHASGLDAEADDIYAVGGAVYTLFAPLIDLVASLVDLVDLVLSLMMSYGSLRPQDILRRLLHPGTWLDEAEFAARRLLSLLSEIGDKVMRITLLVDVIIMTGWQFRAMGTPYFRPDYSLDAFWTSSNLPTLDV